MTHATTDKAEGTRTSRAPSADNAMPDDWTGSPQSWMAYGLIAAGQSQRGVAAELGLSPGTVHQWVKAWRQQFGDGLFKAEAKAATELSQHSLAPGRGQQRKWSEIRGEAAGGYGTTAMAALDLANVGIDELMDSPERRSKLTAGDLLALARSVDLLSKTADRLAGIDSKRAGTKGSDFDASLLAGLEGNREIADVAAATVALMDDFRKRKEESSH